MRHERYFSADSGNFGMEFTERQELSLVLAWGDEILQNLEGIDRINTHLIEQIKSGCEVNPIVYLGRSGTFKDIASEQEEELLKALQSIGELPPFQAFDINFPTSALTAQAYDMIPKTKVQYPDGAVREEVWHRAYTEDEYYVITDVLRKVLIHAVYEMKGQRVLMVKPSAVTYLKTRAGLRFGKNDRGVSMLCNLLTWTKTSETTHVIAAKRDDRVLQETVLPFRRAIQNAKPENIIQILNHFDINFYFKTEAKDTDAPPDKREELTYGELVKLANGLKLMMAPPVSILRSDGEQNDLIKQVFGAGKRKEDDKEIDDIDLYNFIKEDWGMPDERFLVTTNTWLSGTKNRFRLGGFSQHDLVAQMYPKVKELMP